MPNPIVAILDSPNSESKIASMFNIPILTRLRMRAASDSFGTTPIVSAGQLAIYNIANWYATLTAIPEIPAAMSAATTASTMVINQPFLMWDHGPLSVSGLYGQLVVGLANASGGAYNVYINQVDFILSSISSTGAETVLSTSSLTGLTNITSSSSYVAQTLQFAFNLAAPSAVAAGNRLCLRIKTYGSCSTAGTVYHSINSDSGAYNAPANSGNTPSWIVFRV